MTYQRDINDAAGYLQKGLYKRAWKSAASAARKASGQPVSHNLSGIALSGMGKPVDAVAQFQKALKLKPDYADALKNLAQTLIVMGRAEPAVSVLNKAVGLDAKDRQIWALKAQAHSMLGQNSDARASADRAVACAKEHPAGYKLRASILMRMGLTKDAIADLQAALELNPQDVQALTLLSEPFARQNQTEEALSVVDKAVTLEPDNIPAQFRRATQFVEMGDIDAAIAQYRDILDRAPEHPAALERLAQLLTGADLLALESNILSGLKVVANRTEDHASLLFARARVADAAGNGSAAQRYLAKANAEMARLNPYDAGKDAALTHFVLDQFRNTPVIEKAAISDPVPIYILGLPRSGTTLAEAVLGMHPDVLALGERGSLGFLAEETIGQNLPFSEAQIMQFRTEDLRLLPDLPAGLRAYTDKMPENYRLVGLIRNVHPNARIIHVTRDPRATALSMWKSHFSGAALSYTYDLRAMAAKFNLYAETMAHWHSVMPGQILDVAYEDLVRDVTGTGRAIAAFCGLDWHADMARPHESRAQVMTLSATQLRRPVYTSSINAWEVQIDLLLPFVQGLDPALWPGIVEDLQR